MLWKKHRVWKGKIEREAPKAAHSFHPAQGLQAMYGGDNPVPAQRRSTGGGVKEGSYIHRVLLAKNTPKTQTFSC